MNEFNLIILVWGTAISTGIIIGWLLRGLVN